MQTKKIIGIALVAALVGSMASIATTSVSAAAMKSNADFTGNVGIVGSMTGWGKVDDVAMTDADQDGVFEGAFKVKVTANICSINQITLENHLCEVLDYFKDENKFDVSKKFMLLLVSPQGNGL